MPTSDRPATMAPSRMPQPFTDSGTAASRTAVATMPTAWRKSSATPRDVAISTTAVTARRCIDTDRAIANAAAPDQIQLRTSSSMRNTASRRPPRNRPPTGGGQENRKYDARDRRDEKRPLGGGRALQHRMPIGAPRQQPEDRDRDDQLDDEADPGSRRHRCQARLGDDRPVAFDRHSPVPTIPGRRRLAARANYGRFGREMKILLSRRGARTRSSRAPARRNP